MFTDEQLICAQKLINIERIPTEETKREGKKFGGKKKRKPNQSNINGSTDNKAI